MAVLNNDTMRKIALGRRVQRATAAIPQNVTQTLFTVSGGRILITVLLGEVTTAINNAANNTKLISTPTVGTAVDLCTVTSLQAKEIGSLIGLPGEVGSALRVANAGALALPVVGVIVPSGAVGLNCANATGTGSIKWVLYFVPLDDGAGVAVA